MLEPAIKLSDAFSTYNVQVDLILKFFTYLQVVAAATAGFMWTARRSRRVRVAVLVGFVLFASGNGALVWKASHDADDVSKAIHQWYPLKQIPRELGLLLPVYVNYPGCWVFVIHVFVDCATIMAILMAPSAQNKRQHQKRSVTSQPVRTSFQSVIPFLSIQLASKLVEFLVAAFDAVETFRSKTHFEVRIGDSMMMIGDAGDSSPTTGQLFMYVHDAEASYNRAIQAGATSLMEPSDRPWGEGEEIMRSAAVRDPCGNSWFLAGPK